MVDVVIDNSILIGLVKSLHNDEMLPVYHHVPDGQVLIFEEPESLIPVDCEEFNADTFELHTVEALEHHLRVRRLKGLIYGEDNKCLVQVGESEFALRERASMVEENETDISVTVDFNCEIDIESII